MRIWLVAIVAALAAPAGAVTLTFDDLATPARLGSYDGFDFANFYTLTTVGFPASGYVNGVVSGAHVAYNGSGRAAAISSTTAFSLTSGYVAAAWNDGMTVDLVGTLAGAAVFTQSFVVVTARSTFEAFDPALIDHVVITTSGGTHHAGYDAGLGAQLSLDDLTINGTLNPPEPPIGGIVPEPAAWLLMVAGFGLVGASLRRRAPRAA